MKVTELPYYDGEQRMQYIAEELAEADYVALQTKRLYGAVTRDPKKYPLTNNYFYLLFAGDLGYELVYDHASRPSLFGFEIPDELADESLTVYDHPKVADLRQQGAPRGVGDPEPRAPRHSVAQAGSRRPPARHRQRGPAGRQRAPRRRSDRAGWRSFSSPRSSSCSASPPIPVIRRWLPVSGAYALAKVLGVLALRLGDRGCSPASG